VFVDAAPPAGYCRPTSYAGPIHWRLGMKCPRCQRENPPPAKFWLEHQARAGEPRRCNNIPRDGHRFWLEQKTEQDQTEVEG
jgi:hypothetical protein